MKRILICFLLVLASLCLGAPAQAQVEKATVKINGMIWGLWAHGAQKALQRLDGVGRVEVSLARGEAPVFPKPGKSFDPALIPRAISGAGFSASEIIVKADGTLTQKAQALQLTVPGVNHPFVLSGGSQGEALWKREDLLGKEIHLTGKLLVKNTDQIPELTVESFQPKGK